MAGHAAEAVLAFDALPPMSDLLSVHCQTAWFPAWWASAGDDAGLLRAWTECDEVEGEHAVSPVLGKVMHGLGIGGGERESVERAGVLLVWDGTRPVSSSAARGECARGTGQDSWVDVLASVAGPCTGTAGTGLEVAAGGWGVTVVVVRTNARGGDAAGEHEEWRDRIVRRLTSQTGCQLQPGEGGRPGSNGVTWEQADVREADGLMQLLALAQRARVVVAPLGSPASAALLLARDLGHAAAGFSGQAAPGQIAAGIELEVPKVQLFDPSAC